MAEQYLFDTSSPIRRRPTEDELQAALTKGTKMAVWKRHRGRPPRGMDWEDLYQQVMVGALDRLKNFQHGGKFSIDEYCYMASCYALSDIQREEMKRTPTEPATLPLFDQSA